eukprot:3662475-Amphidinium_carterae.1
MALAHVSPQPKYFTTTKGHACEFSDWSFACSSLGGASLNKPPYQLKSSNPTNSPVYAIEKLQVCMRHRLGMEAFIAVFPSRDEAAGAVTLYSLRKRREIDCLRIQHSRHKKQQLLDRCSPMAHKHLSARSNFIMVGSYLTGALAALSSTWQRSLAHFLGVCVRVCVCV